MDAHVPGRHEVEGPNPSMGSAFHARLVHRLERLFYTEDVRGSTPRVGTATLTVSVNFTHPWLSPVRALPRHGRGRQSESDGMHSVIGSRTTVSPRA